MTRETGYVILILSFFFFVPRVYGQDENKSVELKTILEAITKQHHVKFNYLEEDVAGHAIFPPEARLPLKAKLIFISNRTLLNFKQIGIYISISATRKTEVRTHCAFITDENGNPLEDAVVQYGTTTLLTGKDGYFTFPKSVTQVFIEHVAYATKTYTVAETYGDCAEIKMIPAPHELQEIVTERYLATGIAKLKNGSYNIKPSKFGILPGLIEADVLQAMQQLPGINSIDETVSNINVRGGTHDQNLFTWNGIRLFQTGHFFGLISAFNPNLAHNIEISKNGTSAFFGESVSSTVNISSHPEDIERTSGSVGANMISIDAYTRIKTSPTTNIELSARRSYTDVIDFPTYTKYSQRIFQNTVVTGLNTNDDLYYRSDKEFYFYDFTAQVHKKIGKKHHIYVDAIGIKNSLTFTQSTFMPFGLIIKNSSLSQLTLGGTAAWHGTWDLHNTTEASFYASYYNVDALNSSFQDGGRNTLQQNIINDAGFQAAHTYNFNNGLKLKGGYQYNQITIKNRDFIDFPEYERDLRGSVKTHAAIAQAEYGTTEKPLYILGGIRFNYIEPFGLLYAEPRLSLTYKLGQDWQVSLQGERKSQTTSQVVQLQEDFLGIEKRRWVLANNNDIPVQRSSQASVGLTYKRNGLLISLDNFYKKVNGITTGGQAFQNQYELIDATGYYEVLGSEFLVQKQFKHFYVWLSYAYNHNNYHFNQLSPSVFSSNFELPHTVNNAVTYEWKNLKISLGSKFFSGRPYTPPFINLPVADDGSAAIIYDYPNGHRLKSYFQMNFSIGYSVRLSKNSNLQTGISILNLLNRTNTLNRYYRVSSTGNDIDRVNTFGLMRTPNVMAKVTF